ncbi:solute carrier organic anion transporter family member 5A1 [Patella vulgata]|uniref:solute carrier organic anion transporter family member 5A1 n=1 Tax=Patella vulgata TaxID=6465 RepID=UPI00217F51FA|nr:solute carrier organic anion transporter family member 5A1 [Patella vulgata]XP_050389884.1 solute carrier organic anion transporter family member 5A1 [Patella vulgata]
MQQIEPPVYYVKGDLDSPGNVSVGQRSLGVESSVSGYSVSSSKPFLRGKTEKAECVQCRLEADGLDTDESRLCGIGHLRPRCIQKCANIRVFVACMSLLLIVTGALSTGYLNSVITTIEKRFEIGSAVSGIVIASYETGSLISVIFVSYLGGRRHIPKWIAYGVITMGIGAFIFALPHIIAPKYTIDNQKGHNFTDINICRGGPGKDKSGLYEVCINENSGNWIYVLILVAAQVFIGVGGTPILTLGTTYIDNHVTKDQAPQYLAVIYATGALGPVIGYALGALMLQYYVDTFTYDVPITSSHPRWIGAWWGGFIICGFVILMLSIPFIAFPKVLVNEKRKLLEHKAKEDLLSSNCQEENNQYGKTIKDIPRSILRLLKNPVYIITSLGICCEIAIVSGFVVFLPKYIETQFGTSTSVANLFTGGIGIPGAVVGILIGGYILKRFQLRPKGAIQLALALNVLALFGFTFFFFLGCENLKIAGATLPYFNSSGHKIFEANLTSTCNENCDCSNTVLEPICGINGITYFSPCHAGCTGSFGFMSPESQERMFNYSGCACIMGQNMLKDGHEVIMSPIATSGPCKTSCENLLPFLIMLVVMTFCVAGAQMPLLMVTLRSVKQEERAFSLGMQFVILRLFAYVPTPIMFGNIIDTACLLWKKKCERNGACLLYDRVAFRYKYVGMAAVLKVVGLLFFLTVWLILQKKNKSENMQSNLTVGQMMNSVTSIDKLDLDYQQRHKRNNSQHIYTKTQQVPEADETDIMIQSDKFIGTAQSS